MIIKGKQILLALFVSIFLTSAAVFTPIIFAAESDTKLTMKPSASSVFKGEKISFPGKLVDGLGYAISDAKIVIWDKDGSDYQFIGLGFTDARGEYRITVVADYWDGVDNPAEILAHYSGTSFYKESITRTFETNIDKPYSYQNFGESSSPIQTSTKLPTKIELHGYSFGLPLFEGEKRTISGELHAITDVSNGVTTSRSISNAKISLHYSEDSIMTNNDYEFDLGEDASQTNGRIIGTAYTDEKGIFSLPWEIGFSKPGDKILNWYDGDFFQIIIEAEYEGNEKYFPTTGGEIAHISLKDENYHEFDYDSSSFTDAGTLSVNQKEFLLSRNQDQTVKIFGRATYWNNDNAYVLLAVKNPREVTEQYKLFTQKDIDEIEYDFFSKNYVLKKNSPYGWYEVKATYVNTEYDIKEKFNPVWFNVVDNIF